MAQSEHIIKNYDMLLSHGETKTRKVALDIAEAAIQRAIPYHETLRLIRRTPESISIGERTIFLREIDHIYVVGVGKGAYPIAQALEEKLGDLIDEGIVLVKKGDTRRLKRIEIIESGHPLPDQAGIDGAKKTQVLLHIMLPIAKPGLVSVGIYTFLTTWEEFIFALNLTNSAAIRTLPIAIDMFKGEFVIDWGAIMASGAVISLPLSFLSASNLVPKGVALVGRVLIAAIRTIPAFVYGLMFIRVTGPGPFAGLLTMSLCSIGMVSKMFIESIEDLDKRILESLDAAGCTTFQKIRYGILPQLTADFTSTIIYRFDMNLRDATVLGLVGAGGIGAPLIFAMSSYRWNEVGAILLGLIVLVLIIEWISARIRVKLARG